MSRGRAKTRIYRCTRYVSSRGQGGETKRPPRSGWTSPLTREETRTAEGSIRLPVLCIPPAFGDDRPPITFGHVRRRNSRRIDRRRGPRYRGSSAASRYFTAATGVHGRPREDGRSYGGIRRRKNSLPLPPTSSASALERRSSPAINSIVLPITPVSIVGLLFSEDLTKKLRPGNSFESRRALPRDNKSYGAARRDRDRGRGGEEGRGEGRAGVAPFAFIAASVSRREKAARRRFRARASATIAATYAAPIAPHPRPPILPPPLSPPRRSVGAPSRISYRSRPFFLPCLFPFFLPVFFFATTSGCTSRIHRRRTAVNSVSGSVCYKRERARVALRCVIRGTPSETPSNTFGVNRCNRNNASARPVVRYWITISIGLQFHGDSGAFRVIRDKRIFRNVVKDFIRFALCFSNVPHVRQVCLPL